MAQAPYRVAPEVSPTGAALPQTNISVSAEDTGALTARGLQQLGAGAIEMGDFFGQVAADEAGNQYQERVNQILYGKPGAMVQNESGEMVPDTGYMGKKGRAALDARPEVEKEIDRIARETGGGLLTPRSKLQFDNTIRRYKAITDGQIGNHARAEGQVYTTRVNKASEKLAIEQISSDPDNMANVLEGTEKLIAAKVKQAQIEGGGPELINEARASAKRDALTARLLAVGASDPSRALRLLERDKAIAGSQYDNLYNAFRARADQQDGRAVANGKLTDRLEAGHDTKAVLRHFEDFREKAYWDVNAWRVGFGSDTITGPDGRPQAVTQNTTVTREDAERDLDRRAALSQADVRRAIGVGAWDKLDDRTKASLTSIAYNYGGANFPQSVADAAKTGDKEAIAKAIEGLKGHNAGVNARRRGMEAANVRGQDQAPKTQAEMIEEVVNDPSLKDRPEAQSAAIAQVNRSYALRHSQQIKEKANFETKVKNATTEALNTGQPPTNPVPREDFIRQYGERDGQNHYNDYAADIEFGVKYKGMQDMPDSQMNTVVEQSMPAPGDPAYDHKFKNYQRLQKAAVALQKERREDPATAVSRISTVAAAYAQYAATGGKDPEAFQKVAQARLTAQEQMGIEPELRTPITKTEALRETMPLKTMLPDPASVQKTLREVGQKFNKMFGPEAERAFSYALRAQRIDAETAQVAATMVKKLGLGQGVTRADAAAIDEAREADAAAVAVSPSRAPVPTPEALVTTSRLQAIGAPTVQAYTGRGTTIDRGIEPSSWPFPAPPSQSVADLLTDNSLSKDFDAKYGAGMAKEIIEQLGPALKKRGGPITAKDVEALDFEQRTRGRGAPLVDAYRR